MFETIRNYIKDNDYYFIITDNYMYIKNYKKIYEIKNNSILIEIDRLYKIKGQDFKLVKKMDQEIKILGKIESINIT